MSEWRKSTFSEPNGNECVEVRYSIEAVGVRDTKHRAAGTLAFEPGTWTTFVSSLEPRNAR
jgi:hypothetical protein